MSSQEFDPVEQLRRLGIGLVLGGVVFGALSFVVSPFISGIGLLAVGLLVWGIEYRQERTAGIGLGIGFAGAVILLEVVSSTEFTDLTLATMFVGFGIVDYLLAPAYGKLKGAGEQARKNDN